MKNYQKYEKSYFMPPEVTYDWAKKDAVEQPPKWCSVDLRDGNQALIEPMSLDEKLEFFQMLVDIGFKEIEVGFPAASDTEYKFMRTLIEKNMIPDDVTVQVLTQAREHIIRKTFEGLCPISAEKILNYRAVCHAIAYIFVAIVGFLGIFGKLRGVRVQTAAKKVSLYPNVILIVTDRSHYRYTGSCFSD